MNAERFRTTFDIPESKDKITYNDNLTFIGSCFSENIADRMKLLKFNTLANPFGIMFNPLSIENCLRQVINGRHYKPEDLIEYNDKWLSLDHHGDFSDIDRQACLEKINMAVQNAHKTIKNTSFVFITLGTSVVYFYNKTGLPVSNCHKIPANNFTPRRISLKEAVNSLDNIVQMISKESHNSHIIFTVSPIRHWKDGAVENQRSKSTLILAIDEICRKYGDKVGYFPAYEIMNDELRDYRFYADDMLHPSATAVEYIWDVFKKTYIDASCHERIMLTDKLNKALAHRFEHTPSATEKAKFDEYVDGLRKQLDSFL
ncbi:MAG: GSCFA domain-containing protein [Bacteroidales bacterium]|nr:GSCFA domain-containing protein [Bacteroidales bacterium]